MANVYIKSNNKIFNHQNIILANKKYSYTLFLIFFKKSLLITETLNSFQTFTAQIFT